MAEVIHRVGAEIITVTRSEKTDLISARVKLQFRLPDQAGRRAGKIVTAINLTEKDDFHWKRTKRRIVAQAWNWLHNYFEGLSVGADSHNLFNDVFPWEGKVNEYGLTPEEERSLQRELRSIEGERAARGAPPACSARL